MATPLKSRVAIPRIRDNKIDGVKYNRSSSKRNNFEMFAWLGMRLSGVLLVVLIFGHLFVNLMVVSTPLISGSWAVNGPTRSGRSGTCCCCGWRCCTAPTVSVW